MIVDATGRVYGLKETTCEVCGIEMTYTHSRKRFCDECYKKRHSEEVAQWKRDNPTYTAEQRKQEAARRKEKRYTIINEIKATSGCADCGYNLHPAALDFDHVRGEKNFAISLGAGTGISWTKVLEEIAKCEVVCANCHRIRTFERGRAGRSEENG